MSAKRLYLNPLVQHKPNHNSYKARFISFLLNCCIFLSVIAFILSTMKQFQCVRGPFV